MSEFPTSGDNFRTVGKADGGLVSVPIKWMFEIGRLRQQLAYLEEENEKLREELELLRHNSAAMN